MKKLSTLLIASVALSGLVACTDEPQTYDCSEMGELHSKQWSKQKQEYCARNKVKLKEHRHADGTIHVHEGGDKPHYHTAEEISDRVEPGETFLESDNDYSRETTTDYTEDDAEIIEWRKQQRQLPAQ